MEEPKDFTIEVRINRRGVLSVCLLGKDWSVAPQAHALLQFISPLIQELDEQARAFAARPN